eukprot:TRINITY_DN17155_c0_g2_i1.p1 TRINITY_DN17155_c0_g2~~TRINITY_DN17155_c0_g2_i1.p1  ORF type:complete len:243 (+),score=-8.94 TRINITY_DN17155_c0_g2_i1:62-730(+)
MLIILLTVFTQNENKSQKLIQFYFIILSQKRSYQIQNQIKINLTLYFQPAIVQNPQYYITPQPLAIFILMHMNMNYIFMHANKHLMNIPTFIYYLVFQQYLQYFGNFAFLEENIATIYSLIYDNKSILIKKTKKMIKIHKKPELKQQMYNCFHVYYNNNNTYCIDNKFYLLGTNCKLIIMILKKTNERLVFVKIQTTSQNLYVKIYLNSTQKFIDCQKVAKS